MKLVEFKKSPHVILREFISKLKDDDIILAADLTNKLGVDRNIAHQYLRRYKIPIAKHYNRKYIGTAKGIAEFKKLMGEK